MRPLKEIQGTTAFHLFVFLGLPLSFFIFGVKIGLLG